MTKEKNYHKNDFSKLRMRDLKDLKQTDPEKFQNIMQEFSKIMALLLESQSKIINKAKQDINSLTVIFSQQASDLSVGFNELIKNVFETRGDIPNEMRVFLNTISQQGWYFDFHLPLDDLRKWEYLIESNNFKELDNIAVRHYRSQIKNIEFFCAKWYPSRKSILHSAFVAQKHKNYLISIPAFLTQIDGICFQETGYELFISDRNDHSKTKISLYENQIEDDPFFAAILSPLSNKSPISFTEKERGSTFSGLNRHTIIHGESLDYGTEINSLKVISLLNFIVQIFHFDDLDL